MKTMKLKKQNTALKLQNKQVKVQSQLNVNVNTDNEPLALLYKVAIEGINYALKADFTDHAL